MNVPDIQSPFQPGEYRQLARALTLIENDLPGSEKLLKELKYSQTPVIGITGPPGAGKSTLINALINGFIANDKKVAILAIDPTSPFNFGSLLGDRIRMSEHFNKSNVFIRSIATRGSLGGLSAKSIEMTDVLKSAGFDYILIETVGVGQSEVEIAGLADLSIVVLVPESGDEIQNIKSGLMEIADVFVVNKSDREGAEIFANNLEKLLHNRVKSIPVIRTIAEKSIGIDKLYETITSHKNAENEQRPFLMTEKAWKILTQKQMSKYDKDDLSAALRTELLNPDFNLYAFVDEYSRKQGV